MFAAFLKAAIPDPVTVCGVRLRPFSLGHFLLLRRWENAFIQDTPAALGDLLHGVLVCAGTFADAQKALADPDLSNDLKRWARKINGGFLRPARFDYAESVRLFRAYIADGLQAPCVRAEMSGPSRQMGSEWPLLTLTALMEDLGQDFTTAIDQPLGLSRWLVAANGERKGVLEVCEQAAVDGLQQEADAIAAEVFAEEERLKNGLS